MTIPVTQRAGRFSRLRRTLTVILVLGLALLVLAGGYTGYAAVRHVQPVALPAPTGRYPVGRVMFEWTDQHSTDPLAPRPGTKRTLSVWLWYPAKPHSQGPGTQYAPGAWSGLHFPSPASIGETRFSSIRTHSRTRAAVAHGLFPIVVLGPGLGLAAPQYTTLAEDVASHGYLVAGMTPTYSANLTVLDGHAVPSTAAGNPSHFTTAAGNRLIPVWTADARFTATRVAALGREGRFSGHIDARETAYIGHSFGGATSIQACASDPRCAGAVDLDGTPFGPVVQRGLHAPLMIIGADGSCTTGTCQPTSAVERRIRASARSLLAASTGPTWCYSIDGAKHFNFTDYAAYYLAAPLRTLVPLGSIDGRRGLSITDGYVTAFLDHAILGRSEPQLAGRANRYPDVRVLRLPG
ncbi:MAG TPA: hypothetical protein VFT75_05025 [Nocardioidaceae bacterium]|jgi:hypothetical protein|nr:hypothetical protein [Nocardioidaceae bacterium]